jgi:hypothetical protein
MFHAQAEGDIVEYRHVGEKGITLEHGVDVAFVGWCTVQA